MRRSDDVTFFHVCTDGRAVPWIFQDDKDFVAGVNRIAICHLKTSAKVAAYVLMDNHVHFVLRGTMLQSKAFINLYKKLTGMWISQRYGVRGYLDSLPVEIICIDSEEALLNTIAYLDRNPVMAGYRYMCGEYLWGSARFMFRDPACESELKSSFSQSQWRELSSLSVREQRRLLNTHMLLPGNWQINDRGMLHPLCFLEISIAESYYKTPLRYMYFLAKKLEGVVENEFRHAQNLFIPDKELRLIVRQISLDLFSVDNVLNLNVNDRLTIARRLRYDYAASLKQISRMVRLEVSALDGFL
jgi:hypothetical protein